MYLTNILNEIKPGTLISIIDRTAIVDTEIHKIDDILRDPFFQNHLFNRVHRVSSIYPQFDTSRAIAYLVIEID